MIETYTIEQLYERAESARARCSAPYPRPSGADHAAYIKAKSDYQRALIVEARHKQGEY